jgi:hypothetical protein
LHASQENTLRDAAGKDRAWRAELIDALVARQRGDGSWKNDVERWEEAKEPLATIYAVLALEEALKPKTFEPKTRESKTLEPKTRESKTLEP